MKSLYIILFLLLTLPTLLFAQSKKEEILLLNTRIDSLTLVCNKLSAEKVALQKEQTQLQEECTSEKGLLQNELLANQKQLESVKKAFQNERELRLQISEQKRSDSLLLVAEIAKLRQDTQQILDSISSLQELKVAAQKAKTLNGTFYNSKNQSFTISNYSVGESFDFSFKYGVQDEWGCLFETEGTAKLLRCRIPLSKIYDYRFQKYSNLGRLRMDWNGLRQIWRFARGEIHEVCEEVKQILTK